MRKRFGLIMFLVTAVALFAVVACGSSSTATVLNQLPPTHTPVKGDPPPDEPKPIEVPAPIEDATVVAPAEPGGDYILRITSGLPNGCAEFNGYEVLRDGDRFVVSVTNLVPHPSLKIACTEIYRTHQSEVLLDSGLTTLRTYTIEVNGEFSRTFIAHDASGLAMVEKESPIERINVVETDLGYVLSIISRLPKGSSCSKFNGYKINTRFAESIEVTVTHVEVPDRYVGVCTSDLPAVTTEILLGSGFSGGQTYDFSVNDAEFTFPLVSDSTSDQDSSSGTPVPVETPAPNETIAVPAPIEKSTVVAPGTVDGPYIVEITSGLPSGCASFNAYHLSLQGNEFTIEVTNRIPADRAIACTAIYGYHDGQIGLGDGPLKPGETYIVTINGEQAHTFIAK